MRLRTGDGGLAGHEHLQTVARRHPTGRRGGLHEPEMRPGAWRDGDTDDVVSVLPAERRVPGLVEGQRAVVQGRRPRTVRESVAVRQRGARLVEAGLERADRDAEHGGGLLVRELLQVEQLDRVPLAGGKVGDGGAHAARQIGGAEPLFERRHALGAGEPQRRVVIRERRVGYETGTRAPADADRDAAQPPAEGVGVAQAAEPQQREHERILDAVVGQRRAGQPAAQLRQRRDTRRDERGEGAMIARRRAADERSVVFRRAHALSVARIWSASRTFWRISCWASASTSFQLAGSSRRARTRGHSTSIMARAVGSSRPASAARRIACSRSPLPPASTTCSGAPWIVAATSPATRSAISSRSARSGSALAAGVGCLAVRVPCPGSVRSMLRRVTVPPWRWWTTAWPASW